MSLLPPSVVYRGILLQIQKIIDQKTIPVNLHLSPFHYFFATPLDLCAGIILTSFTLKTPESKQPVFLTQMLKTEFCTIKSSKKFLRRHLNCPRSSKHLFVTLMFYFAVVQTQCLSVSSFKTMETRKVSLASWPHSLWLQSRFSWACTCRSTCYLKVIVDIFFI